MRQERTQFGLKDKIELLALAESWRIWAEIQSQLFLWAAILESGNEECHCAQRDREKGAYTYDVNNLRVARIKGSETTVYAYGRNGALTYQKNLATGKARTYAYLGSEVVGWTDTAADGTQTKMWALTDQLGSVTKVTNAAAEVVWSSEYNPFGKTAGIEGLYDFDGSYAGHQPDNDVGLIYMWNRWQDPETGRFISEDFARDGVNWYSYAHSNPLRWTDPTGLMTPEETAKYYAAKAGQTIVTTSNGITTTPSSGSNSPPPPPAPPVPAITAEDIAKFLKVYETSGVKAEIKKQRLNDLTKLLAEEEIDGEDFVDAISKMAMDLHGDRGGDIRGFNTKKSIANELNFGLNGEGDRERLAYAALKPQDRLSEAAQAAFSEAGAGGMMLAGALGAGGMKTKGGAAGKVGTETVQRVMSRAELEATQNTGLLRGGRPGTHYVTPAASNDALRARQRLALGQTPEVKVTMEVPRGAFTPPSRVQPLNNMPGGGMERTATGRVPVNIVSIRDLK